MSDRQVVLLPETGRWALSFIRNRIPAIISTSILMLRPSNRQLSVVSHRLPTPASLSQWPFAWPPSPRTSHFAPQQLFCNRPPCYISSTTGALFYPTSFPATTISRECQTLATSVPPTSRSSDHLCVPHTLSMIVGTLIYPDCVLVTVCTENCPPPRASRYAKPHFRRNP